MTTRSANYVEQKFATLNLLLTFVGTSQTGDRKDPLMAKNMKKKFQR